MSEKADTIKLANKILEDPHADPDDDLAMLSRQFLRALETIEAQHKQLREVDWEGQAQLDLINSNRDEILKKHQEAIRLIRKWRGYQDKVEAIIDALNLFHPMHEESWQGWPKGTE